MGIPVEDIAYAAGFFDGEGHVAAYIGSGPNRNAMVFKVTVTQSSNDEHPPQVLTWYRDYFGGSLHRQRGLSPLTRRVIWDWTTTSRNARDFLAAVYPHLKVKQEHVAYLLKTWEVRADRPELERRLTERKLLFGRQPRTVEEQVLA